mgnify:CR=1 FL=1
MALTNNFFLLDFPGVIARREGREGTGVDDGEGEGEEQRRQYITLDEDVEKMTQYFESLSRDGFDDDENEGIQIIIEFIDNFFQ